MVTVHDGEKFAGVSEDVNGLNAASAEVPKCPMVNVSPLRAGWLSRYFMVLKVSNYDVILEFFHTLSF